MCVNGMVLQSYQQARMLNRDRQWIGIMHCRREKEQNNRECLRRGECEWQTLQCVVERIARLKINVIGLQQNPNPSGNRGRILFTILIREIVKIFGSGNMGYDYDEYDYGDIDEQLEIEEKANVSLRKYYKHISSASIIGSMNHFR
jgi:hypothetical protein